MANRSNGDAAGREADRPSEIPPRGWFAVLKRVKAEVKEDNATLLAAGVAFYAMLAIFPAIIAVVTVYGMVADPNQVQSQVNRFAKSLPSGADQLLTEQLKSVTSAGRQSLSIGLVVSLLAVLWSASGGVQGLVKGLNLVYDEKESRGFLKLRGLSLLLTLGAILTAVVAIALVAVIPDEFMRDAHHWLILHGRYICKARKPECWRCVIADLCRYVPKTPPPEMAIAKKARAARLGR